MDKIGFRAVQAIEEKAKKNGTRASKEYRKLDVSSNTWHSWKRLNFAPSAYFLRKMALAGYDVLYILTGIKTEECNEYDEIDFDYNAEDVKNENESHA